MEHNSECPGFRCRDIATKCKKRLKDTCLGYELPKIIEKNGLWEIYIFFKFTNLIPVHRPNSVSYQDLIVLNLAIGWFRALRVLYSMIYHARIFVNACGN